MLRRRARLLRQQPREQRRIRARYLDDLRPAAGARYQRYLLTADPERPSHRGECCRGSLAVHGTLADPDNKRPVMLAAHARTGRAGLHPDGDAHEPSVRSRRRSAPPHWRLTDQKASASRS